MEELTPLQRDFLSGLGDQQKVKEWLEDNHSERTRRTGRTHAILAKAIGDALWSTPGTKTFVKDHYPTITYDHQRMIGVALEELLRQYHLENDLAVQYRGKGYPFLFRKGAVLVTKTFT